MILRQALRCERLLVAVSGPSIYSISSDLNVRYRAKQTFRVQAGITVQLPVGERPLYPLKQTLG